MRDLPRHVYKVEVKGKTSYRVMVRASGKVHKLNGYSASKEAYTSIFTVLEEAASLAEKFALDKTLSREERRKKRDRQVHINIALKKKRSAAEHANEVAALRTTLEQSIAGEQGPRLHAAIHC